MIQHKEKSKIDDIAITHGFLVMLLDKRRKGNLEPLEKKFLELLKEKTIPGTLIPF